MSRPNPARWGLTRRAGRLSWDGADLCDLAAGHDTPLYVVSAALLRARCKGLQAAFAEYPRPVRIAYSYKTNPVAGVLRLIHACGLGAEVVNGYELWLAKALGLPGERIVFNGPNKTDAELAAAVAASVGLLVVDGLDELDRIVRLAGQSDRVIDLGLRVCPDVVPRGMNASSVTGSRRNQFGLEMGRGLVSEALRRIRACPGLRLRAVQAHVGSGIHDLSAFRRTVERVLEVQAQAFAAGLAPGQLDLGGGLGTGLSREFSTREMLWYLGTGRLPRDFAPAGEDLFDRYGREVTDAVVRGCAARRLPVPTLVLEPGRAISSDAQLLLLRVGAVRERPGVGRFALCDGGAMSVSMMFLSEMHAVFLANRDAPDDGPTSVFGRVPSPMDVVYRNLPLPRLETDDLLAVMDAGAYFTSTATNFGGPRPAVVLVEDGAARLVRRRETYADLARVELDLPEAP